MRGVAAADIFEDDLLGDMLAKETFALPVRSIKLSYIYTS